MTDDKDRIDEIIERALKLTVPVDDLGRCKPADLRAVAEAAWEAGVKDHHRKGIDLLLGGQTCKRHQAEIIAMTPREFCEREMEIGCHYCQPEAERRAIRDALRDVIYSHSIEEFLHRFDRGQQFEIEEETT